MAESNNRIAVGTQAKLYTSSAQRRSSEQSSINPQINKLIKNVSKSTSFAYSSAIARAKLSPLDELQRRVFKKLRPQMSTDRFSQMNNAVSSLQPLQRLDWLLDQERRLNGHS